MIIRKLFKFENAHIVRNCTSDRCSRSIHGHSYKVEILLEANGLDNGQMIYDFGLLKGNIKDLIDSFDHAIAFWDKDDPEYVEALKKFSARWISLPVSPSAEQLARVIFFLVSEVLDSTKHGNNESSIWINSVIVHETETGYAQAFIYDITNPTMGELNLKDIVFSPQVISEWADPELYNKMLAKIPFVSKTPPMQVNATVGTHYPEGE